MEKLAYTGGSLPITDGRFLLMPPKNDPMFLHILEHRTNREMRIFRKLHTQCFDAATRKFPVDYSIMNSRTIEVARALCDECGQRLDAAQAARDTLKVKRKITDGSRRLEIVRKRLEKAEEAKRIELLQQGDSMTDLVSNRMDGRTGKESLKKTGQKTGKPANDVIGDPTPLSDANSDTK